MTESTQGLMELLEIYRSSAMASNPPAPAELEFTAFIDFVQTHHNDVASWTEDDWAQAARKFGIPEEDLMDTLEEVASWSIVDNHQWMGQ